MTIPLLPLLYEWQSWAILALVLVLIDAMMGFVLVLLPFGVSAVVMALFVGLFDWSLGRSWHFLIVMFTLIAVVAGVGIWRYGKANRRDAPPDINKY